MRHLNLETVELTHDDDPTGYHARYARLGRLLGAEQAGATLYELPPGQSNCPYHYEVGDEEWLLVLAGRLTVRHPGGAEELGPGEMALFPAGPEGAHKLTNNGEETVRLFILSVNHTPAVSVYPDSDKVGTFTRDPAANVMVRRDADVGYWHGEV
jgi:uncharacterized cupin superfamily protein